MWKTVTAILGLTLCIVMPDTLFGQNGDPSLKVEKYEPVDTLQGWDYELVAGLNGSQSSFDNWSQGGVNTISGTGSTYFNAKYRKDQFGYMFTADLKYGKSQIEDRGTRKASDQLIVKNRFSYSLKNRAFDIYGNIDFSSQFDEGYDYSGDSPVLISSFLSPAYLNTGVGISHKFWDLVNAQAGFALKQTFMRSETLSPTYGMEEGDHYRLESGLSVNITMEKRVMENIRLRSGVETFTNLAKSWRRTDINFSNELVGSINNYVNASLQFVMIYDRDFSKEVQIKQALSAGVSISIL